MSSYFTTGDIVWVQDPTGAHADRPVIVISHEHRPHRVSQCTVLCCGHNNDYSHSTPELTDDLKTGITFSQSTYIYPWAFYTIAPGAILTGKQQGELTEDGRTTVKREFLKLFR